MAIDPFGPESNAAKSDGVSIWGWFGDHLRTDVVVPVLDLGNGSGRFAGQRRTIVQASWKWTEGAGQYVGCPYWSVAAIRDLGRFAVELPRLFPCRIGLRRAKKKRGTFSLRYEHVFPRHDLFALLLPYSGRYDPAGEHDRRELLESYAVACIITHSERTELRSGVGDRTNPWNRFGGTSIRIADNPEWPERHRDWIEQAGLLAG